MSISAVGSSVDLSSVLRTSGLSADKIEVVQQDVAELQQKVSSSGSQSLDSDSFREALEARIDSDVASGKLSEEDAATVKQALGLDEEASAEASDETSDAAGADAAAAAGGARGGGGAHGGGGGGEAEKTELSRTETVASGVKTTVIVYDDGSSETQTSFTTDPDTGSSAARQADSSSETAKAYGQGAENYLSTLEPGTLFDVKA